MSKTKHAEASNDGVEHAPATLGRKRDHTADDRIIEAALDVLAESGFDSMTMDVVAARAKAGKATVYRRWASKAELVRDALIRMSRSSVELDDLPDTGDLRDDLLSLLKPYSAKSSERKLRVLARLGSFFSEHQQLAEEAMAGIYEPWTDVNRKLMRRAIERGELPAGAPVDSACGVIVAMVSYNSLTLRKPFGKAAYSALLDDILLPALRSPKQPG